MMRPSRNVCLRWCAFLLLLLVGPTPRAEARGVGSLSDEQVREVVGLTIKRLRPGETLNVRRRKDLEEILSTLEAKQLGTGVYFL